MNKLILPFLLLFSIQVYADVFKGIGQNGETIYSDRPTDGAEPVNLKGYSTYQPPRYQRPPNPQEKLETEPTAFAYKKIGINQPVNDATLFYSEGPVNVAVTLDPGLRETDSLLLYLDGQRVGKPLNTTAFSLALEDRGTHNIRVAIQDKDGNELGSSEPVQFYLRKHSVLFKKPK